MKDLFKYQNIQKIKVSELLPIQGTFKELSKKNFEKLKNSISKNGFIQPFFIWENENKKYILDGHQRQKAIVDLYGDIFVSCIVIDAKNLQEAKKLVLFYSSQYGEFSKESFLDFGSDLQFPDIEDFSFPGFSFNADDFLNVGNQDKDDEIPEVAQNECGVELGDIYTLGDHRLMCGDSTDIEKVDILFDGEQSDICFTSPPYNIGIDPNQQNKYKNNSDDLNDLDYLEFLKKFTAISLQYCKFVFVNIQSLAGNKVALIDYLHGLKKNYADTIIWDKGSAQPAMAKNVLNSRYEYVHVFNHSGNRSIGTIEFRGDLANVISMTSRDAKEFAQTHKATFPVSFATHFVLNFAKESIFDPFGGSGSTLIACEKTKRKCYMMELDPHYCSVIIKRWEKFTGQKAVKCE